MENKLHKISIIDTNEKFELKLDGFKINEVKEYEIKNSVYKKVAELSIKIVLKSVDGYIESNEKTAQETQVQEQLIIIKQDVNIENIAKMLKRKIDNL